MSRTVGVSRDLSHRLGYRSLTVSAFLFNRPTTRGLRHLDYVTLTVGALLFDSRFCTPSSYQRL
jgi:hypothetical protein